MGIITISKETAREVLLNNLLIPSYLERDEILRNDLSHYNLLKDEIFIKKDAEILKNDIKDLIIDVYDESRFSKKKIINTYHYNIKEHDSLYKKGVLKNFSITTE